MRLYDLPPEIMRELTEWAGGNSSISLMLSGCFPLRHLMSHRDGVTVVNLYDSSPRSTSRIPMVLSEWKGLKVLRIDRLISPLGSVSLASHCLSKLSELRVLHLRCSDSGAIIKGLTLSQIFPKLEDLYLSCLFSPLSLQSFPISLKRCRIGKYSWFSLSNDGVGGIKMPNLESLTNHMDFDFQLLHCFPSLTRLHIKSCNAALSKVLPPTLRVLRSKSISKPEVLKMLPISLQTLDIHILFVEIPHDSFIHLADLRHLKLTSENSVFSILSKGPSFLFPKTLLSIHFMANLITDSFEFPSELRSLHLEGLSFRGAFNFGSLPPSLQSLSIGKISHLNDSHQQLTSLSLQESHRLLTTSITDLSLGFSIFPSFLCQLLPPSLKNLSLSYTSPSAPYSTDCFPHLQCLALICPDSSIDSEIFHFLPSTLSSLKVISRDPFSESLLSILPRTIQFLTLVETGDERCALSPSHFSILSSYTSLQLLRTTMEIPCIEDQMIGWLPKSLIHLALLGSFSSLSSQCFTFLPRQLESLMLPTLVKCQDEDVKGLPRRLRSIELSKSFGFTKECIAYLPTTLKRISGVGEVEKEYEAWKRSFEMENDWQDFPDPRVLNQHQS